VKLACRECRKPLLDVDVATYVQHAKGAWEFPPAMPSYVKCAGCGREVGERGGGPLSVRDFRIADAVVVVHREAA
jgi:hypothetical protein